MTTALVASATGYTGRDVVRALRTTGIETVAHVRPDASRLDEGYEAVDYGLTVLLYRAVAEAVPGARFVYLSAAGVREGGGNAYLAARGRVERLLREGAVPFTIARPSFITGPDRDEFRPGERLGAALVDGLLRVAGWCGGGRLRERYRSTTNVALARALVRIATAPGGAGGTFESEALR